MSCFKLKMAYEVAWQSMLTIFIATKTYFNAELLMLKCLS